MSGLITFDPDPPIGGRQVVITASDNEHTIVACSITIAGAASGSNTGERMVAVTVTPDKTGGTIYAHAYFTSDAGGRSDLPVSKTVQPALDGDA
jgi:hypothetical protein